MKYELIFVEDDNQIRNGLSHFFPWEQLGFNMTASFENGMQALDYVRSHHVDVILTDVRMPVMDGLEMLEKNAVGKPGRLRGYSQRIPGILLRAESHRVGCLKLYY